MIAKKCEIKYRIHALSFLNVKLLWVFKSFNSSFVKAAEKWQDWSE